MSRRDLLRAAGWGSVAFGLGACSPATTPRPVTPTPPGTPAPTPGVTPTPTSTPSATSSPTPTIPLADRIARLLVVGFRGTQLAEADWIAEAIADDGLGGVILFSRDGKTRGPRNVEAPQQLRTLADDLRALAVDRTLLVAIDQEGGRVARLSPATGFPAFASQAEIGTKDDSEVTEWATSIASTLAETGINVNLAPVVDVDVNPRNPAIGALDRSFSADPDVVTRLARHEIAAHRSAGVRTTLKHFPGLGSATVNTDYGVADVTDTWSRRELEPFHALIETGDADCVMVGHLVNGQLDPGVPASLSAATVTGLLRGELGWDGPVITDDLQAAAIRSAFGEDEAIALALEAGCDLLLLANQQVYEPAIVTRTVQLVMRLVEDGRIAESRIDASFERVRAFAG